MVGWGITDSMTWVWVELWEGDGQGDLGMLQFLGPKESDMTETYCTDLISVIVL